MGYEDHRQNKDCFEEGGLYKIIFCMQDLVWKRWLQSIIKWIFIKWIEH